MMTVLYGLLIAGLTLWELPPLLRQRKRGDIAAYVTLTALACALLVLLTALGARYGIKDFLW